MSIPLLAIVGPPFPLIFALLVMSRWPRHRWPAFISLATAGGMVLLDIIFAFSRLGPLWLAPAAGLVAIGLVYLVRLPWKTNWIGMALAIGGFLAAGYGALEVLTDSDDETPLFFLPRAGTAAVTAMIVMALGFNAAHEKVKRIPVVDAPFGPDPEQQVVADPGMYVHVLHRLRHDLASSPTDLALAYVAARLTRGGIGSDPLRGHLIALATDTSHAPETGPALLQQRLQSGEAPAGGGALPDPYQWQAIAPETLRQLALDDGRYTRLWRTTEKARRTMPPAVRAKKLPRVLRDALTEINEPADLAPTLAAHTYDKTDPVGSRHNLNRAVLAAGPSTAG